MSSNEEMETKAGHPPALKVGGKRIPHRTQKTSEEVTEKVPVEEEVGEDEEGEDTPVSKSPKQPQLMMWGSVRDPSKDYPTQAVQHMQNKPQPTNEPINKPMSAKPNIIQQPRK